MHSLLSKYRKFIHKQFNLSSDHPEIIDNFILEQYDKLFTQSNEQVPSTTIYTGSNIQTSLSQQTQNLNPMINRSSLEALPNNNCSNEIHLTRIGSVDYKMPPIQHITEIPNLR